MIPNKPKSPGASEAQYINPAMCSPVITCAHAPKIIQTDMKIYKIRKLTPKECFRLMGVDDKDFDKIQQAGISDSQLYKLAGNSIVVDVLAEIFTQMFKDEYSQ